MLSITNLSLYYPDETPCRKAGAQMTAHMGSVAAQKPTLQKAILQKPTLCNISFKVQQGECVVVCGKSGSGKSSLLHAINGLATRYYNARITGQIRCNGAELTSLHIYEISQLVASVFQNPKTSFFNVNTTMELVFALENMGVDPGEMQRRIDALSERIPIAHLLNRDIFALSGGEKQLLAIAAAYITCAPVIVLDEPSSNLDAELIDAMAKLLAILKSQHVSLIIAEHRLYYAMDIAGRVIVLEHGHVCMDTSARAFCALGEDERQRMGLRCITKPQLAARFAQPLAQGAECAAGAACATSAARKTGAECATGAVRKTGAECETGSELKPQHIAYLTITHLELAFSATHKLCIQKYPLYDHCIYGIVGKNGLGKSTLLRALMGLQKGATVTRGKNAGKRLSRRARSRYASWVMQDVSYQFFMESAAEELCFGTNVKPCELTDPHSQAYALLSNLNLLQYITKHPFSLSGGQRQRLAIAVALLQQRDVVFMDEPTSGMDFEHMMRISRVLAAARAHKHLIVIVSHDVEFLNATADYIINLEDFICS